MALKRPRKTKLELGSSRAPHAAVGNSTPIEVEIHPASSCSASEDIQETDSSSPCTNPIVYLCVEECTPEQDHPSGADCSRIAIDNLINKTLCVGESSDKDDGLQPPAKKKKKHYNQKFRENWKLDAELRDWLQRDPKNPTQAYCVVCDEHLRGSIHHMKRHSRTRSHQKKVQQCTTMVDSSKFVSECSFIVEHNNSFTLMDHLPHLIQEICPDSSVVHHLQCVTTEGKDIVNMVSVMLAAIIPCMGCYADLHYIPGSRDF